LAREVHVETPEVDELAGGVDLGLVRGLALPQHRRRVEPSAPRTGEQVRGLQEDRCSRLERRARPVMARIERRRDRLLHVVGVRFAPGADDGLTIVRLHEGERFAARDATFAADRHRQFVRFGTEPVELGEQCTAFDGSGRVVEHRFVRRDGDVDDAVHRSPPFGGDNAVREDIHTHCTAPR
jgi:hypothetical protein